MNPDENGTVAIRQELERILAGAEFSRSERMGRFLRFVVEQTLEGKSEQLKETVIGIEVFSRKADYDPRHDPVVRMEAAKLRSRLAEYYAASGAGNPLRIEIPKGAYIPQWRTAAPARPAPRWKLAGAYAVAICFVTVGVLVWRQPAQIAANSKPPADDPAAVALYQKGRAALDDRARRASFALQYFDQAIEKSPSYAPAYVGSADALLRMDEEHRLEHQQAMDRATAAAEKALQLDPKLAEAYGELAVVRVREYRWQEAERLFHQAIELNPNSILAHAQLGFWLLLPERRWDEAVRELRRAVALDPLSSQSNTFLAYAFFWASRFSEAEEQARHTSTLDPPQPEPYFILGQALYWQRRYGDALAALQEAHSHAPGGAADAWLACGQVQAGHRKEALRILKDNLPGGSRVNVPERRLFALYSCLGEKERAFESLEKMYAQGEPHLPIFLLYPEMDGLRADPRFAAMLRRTGLDVSPAGADLAAK